MALLVTTFWEKTVNGAIVFVNTVRGKVTHQEGKKVFKNVQLTRTAVGMGEEKEELLADQANMREIV